MRILRITMVMGLMLLVTACVPYSRSRPAYVDLCVPDQAFTVQTAPGEQTLVLQTYLYNHRTTTGTIPFRQYSFWPAEDSKSRYVYVQLVGYNKGRTRPARPGDVGRTPVPMYYDSRAAFLRKNDGSVVSASPDVYLSSTTFDSPSEAAGSARPSPYDINGDEVHRNVPKRANNLHYGSVFVVFKSDAFDETSRWTFDLGSLEVEGKQLRIAPLTLCHHPEKRWLGVEPVIRP